MDSVTIFRYNSMIKTRLTILIIASLTYLKGFSQIDFRPGFYISLSNDTVYGLIDYRGEIRNSKICAFKKEVNDEEHTFKPNEISAYRFIESKYYISKVIKSQEGEELSVFLEFLVNGITDLFYYIDSNGDHYFIETKKGKMTELTNEEIDIIKDGQKKGIANTNKYIGLLRYEFSDCPEIQTAIDNAGMNHKSLIRVVKDYHNYVCKDEQCIVYEKKIPTVKFNFGAMTSYTFSDLSFDDDDDNDEFYSCFNMKLSKSPSFGAFIKIHLPELNEKISFDFGAEYSENYYYGTHQTQFFEDVNYYELHVHTGMIESFLGFVYTFPKRTFRPTMSFGGIFNYLTLANTRLVYDKYSPYSIYSNETYSTPISSVLLGFYLQTGGEFEISEKLSLFTYVKYHGSLGSNSELKTKIKSLGLSIGLLF